MHFDIHILYTNFPQARTRLAMPQQLLEMTTKRTDSGVVKYNQAAFMGSHNTGQVVSNSLFKLSSIHTGLR